MQVMPDEIKGQVDQLFARAPAAAGEVQQEAQQAQQAAGGGSMLEAAQRVVRGVQDGATPQDRDAALNVIAQQAGISREEAEQRLTQFQATYRDYSQRAAEQARQTAEVAASTVAQVSFWSVVALVLGALLAAGATQISAEAGYAGVGPNFLPLVVGVMLTLCGGWLDDWIKEKLKF